MVKKIKRRQPKKGAKRRHKPMINGRHAVNPDEFLQQFITRRSPPRQSLQFATSVLIQSSGDFILRSRAHPQLNELIRSERLYPVNTSPAAEESFAQQHLGLSIAYGVATSELSPVNHRLYGTWSTLDLQVGPHGESIAQQMIAETHTSSPELPHYLRALRDSQLGVYIYDKAEPCSDELNEAYGYPSGTTAHHLQELVTGQQVMVFLRETRVFQTGELFLMRLVELRTPELLRSEPDASIVCASLLDLYLLSSPIEEWSAYFQRVLPLDKDERAERYRRLMKSEQSPLIWLEFVHHAYAGELELESDEGRCMILRGVPDQLDSLPKGRQARASLLAAS